MIVALCFILCLMVIPSQSNMNVDQVMEDGGECMFNIICLDNKPLDVKHLIDQLANQTLIAMMDECSFDHPKVLFYFNLEIIRSKRIWLEEIPKDLCDSKVKEPRDKLAICFTNVFYERMKFCWENEDASEEILEECKGMENFVTIQQQLNMRQFSKGECNFHDSYIGEELPSVL